MFHLENFINKTKASLKKHQRLYAFLWGLPLYRKAGYCLHARPRHYIDRSVLSGSERFLRAADMFLCLWVYGCSYSEYNLYGFSKLKHRDRREFIGDCCRKKYYMKFNSVADIDCFRNKYQAYQEFEQYYGRYACAYRAAEGFDRFCEIIRTCGTAMVKPATASGGYGIMKVSDKDPDAVRTCFDMICSIALNEDIIIEEYVKQVPELKALHPASLNTARIITVVDRDGAPHIVGTLFRIGKDGTVVDNGASGGILCALSDDGVIQKSVDKKNNRFYIRHPNTDRQLVGFTIPRWNEARALAMELARKKSGIRYCGWDLALTSGGWVMIEGNEGAELAGIQLFGGGCKPILKKYL